MAYRDFCNQHRIYQCRMAEHYFLVRIMKFRFLSHGKFNLCCAQGTRYNANKLKAVPRLPAESKFGFLYQGRITRTDKSIYPLWILPLMMPKLHVLVCLLHEFVHNFQYGWIRSLPEDLSIQEKSKEQAAENGLVSGRENLP